MHVCITASQNCINHHSYGEICVRCGCCEREENYRTRIINRLRYYKECLQEQYGFDDWIDGWRAEQEENIRKSIVYYKRKIRLCKKILKCCRRDKYVNTFTG